MSRAAGDPRIFGANGRDRTDTQWVEATYAAINTTLAQNWRKVEDSNPCPCYGPSGFKPEALPDSANLPYKTHSQKLQVM